MTPLLVVYLVIQMAGVMFSSENMDLALPNLITYITEGMLLFLLVTNVVRTPAMLRLVIWVLLVAGLFMGGLSLFQYVTNTLDNNYGGFAQNEEQTVVDATAAIDDVPALVRQAGPVGEKNRYSQIMLMLVPLGMFRFWGERSKVLKAAAAVCTAFCLIGSLLTFSRGGIVALALTLLIMALLRYIKIRDILLVIGAMVLVLVMFPQNLERLSSLEALTAIFDPDTTAGIKQTDGAVQGRATEMIAAGLVFLDHPLVGVGPGMFPYYVEQYARGLGIRLLTTNREAHSLYLGTAAEVGGLGLLCFLGMVGISMVYLARGHKRWQHSRPDIANLNASFMFVLVVYMTTGLFLHMSYERYFWSMLALANVAIYLASHAAGNSRCGQRCGQVYGQPCCRPGKFIEIRLTVNNGTSSNQVDYNLHGAVGIRLCNASAADVAAVTRQLGPIQGSLTREPDIVIDFVDQVPLSSPLRYLGVNDSAFTDDAFLVLRSKNKATRDGADPVRRDRPAAVPHRLRYGTAGRAAADPNPEPDRAQPGHLAPARLGISLSRCGRSDDGLVQGRQDGDAPGVYGPGGELYRRRMGLYQRRRAAHDRHS